MKQLIPIKFEFRKINMALVAMFISLFVSKTIVAQDIPDNKTDDSDIQQLLETLSENVGSDDVDYTSLLESMIYYKAHPINLNNTNKEELQQILFLNDIQINNLLRHIERNGKLITIYELQGIDGWDLGTIKKVLPYVYVSDNFNSANFSVKEMFKNGQNVVLMRYARVIEKQTGYTPIDSAALAHSPNSRYVGSPDRVYVRYRFTYGTNVSWGITAEKDPGELLLKNNLANKYGWYEQSMNGNLQNGFDYYSAHFAIKNVKFIKSFVLGDYQATFGQGLVAWSAFAFSKNANNIGMVKKSGIGIKPYTSVNEFRYLRGSALTVKLGKKMEATGFFSHKSVDANVADTLDNGEVAAISSIQQTGYHRTAAEVADKNSIMQTIYGGNVSYKGKRLSLGTTAISYSLNKDFNRDLSYYNQFEFSSRNNSNVGVDYNYIIRNFNFFGEAAMSQNGGKAFLSGMLLSLDPRLSFTMLYRNYDRNYQNLISNGFADGPSASNEKGTYMAIAAQPSKNISITAFYDRFEFPWLRSVANVPSSFGSDFLTQINYTPSKKYDMYFRVRQRNKEQNSTDPDADIDYLVPVKQTNYRFNVSYSILPTVKLKNRIEMVDYKYGDAKTEKGFMAYQDVVYNKPGNPFSFTLRYALFQTDSYNTRIYTYENEIPGVYSIVPTYYRGSRFYLLLDYNITRRIEVWVRYSQTFYDDRNVISPGSTDEILGNTKSEIKAQIKFKF